MCVRKRETYWRLQAFENDLVIFRIMGIQTEKTLEGRSRFQHCLLTTILCVERGRTLLEKG